LLLQSRNKGISTRPRLLALAGTEDIAERPLFHSTPINPPAPTDEFDNQPTGHDFRATTPGNLNYGRKVVALSGGTVPVPNPEFLAGFQPTEKSGKLVLRHWLGHYWSALLLSCRPSSWHNKLSFPEISGVLG